jgi:hypothetical protein
MNCVGGSALLAELVKINSNFVHWKAIGGLENRVTFSVPKADPFGNILGHYPPFLLSSSSVPK